MTDTHESSTDEALSVLDDIVELDAVIAGRAVRTVFQPIVDLATKQPLAYEALSRGPVGSPLERPDRLFAAARAAGRVTELDDLCRGRALEAVADSDLRGPSMLFINREPQFASPTRLELEHRTMLRERGLRTVIEFTERRLSHDPAMLLAYANHLREVGCGIALDDVGVDADSLALMPFLMPDVVKLDMGLVQRPVDEATVDVVMAVRAHAERRGASILAEGIETPEHEQMALAMGATLGQGWLYGRPAPLPPARTEPAPAPPRPLVLRAPDEELEVASPFAMVTERHAPLRAPVDLLFALRRRLEQGVGSMRGLAVVLLSCVDAPAISDECADHYAELAAHARFAVALGAGMPEELVPGLRGSQLSPDDPVSSEWDMVVVTPHFSAAVIARERFDVRPDEGRVFDYVLTYDRTLVVDVARTLMMRALPRGESAAGPWAELDPGTALAAG